MATRAASQTRFFHCPSPYVFRFYDHISKCLDPRMSWPFLWALHGECACSLSFFPISFCLWFYVFDFFFPPPWQRPVPNIGHHPDSPPFPSVSLTLGMVTRQAVLHFLGPTLNVLSFISQAHYLDRVVKGMVFLYFPVVFVSVFVCERKSRVHIEMYTLA